MSRYTLFHNRKIIHPGAEAYVDVTGMVQPGVDIDRVSAIIGEAPYGEPGVVHIFADSEASRQLFGAGSELANGIQLLFSPSNDTRVVGGAVLVYAYKANRSSQAEYWLTRDPETGPILQVVTGAAAWTSSLDAYVEFAGSHATDLYKNLIVEVYSGRGRGQQYQIGSSIDVGGNHRLYLRPDLDWATVPTTTPPTTIAIKVPQNKFLAAEWGTLGMANKIEYGIASSNEAFQLQATYNERQETSPSTFGGLVNPTLYIKFDPTGGGSQLMWSDPNNWHVAQAVNASGTTVAATTTTLDGATGMNVDTAGTPGDMKNRWAIITGTTKTSDAQHLALLGKMFRVEDNTATTLTLYSPGLGVTLSDPAGLQWKVMQLSDVYIQVHGKNGASETLEIYMKDRALYNTKIATIDLTALTSLNGLVEQLNEIPGVTARLGDGVDGSLTPDRFDFGEASEHYGLQSIGIIGADKIIGDTSITLNSTVAYEGGAIFEDPGGNYSYPVIVGRGTAREEIVRVDDVTTHVLSLTSGLQYAHTAAQGDLVERIAHGLSSSVDAEWTLASPAGSDSRIYKFGTQLIRGPGDLDANGDPDPGEIVRDNNQKLQDSTVTTFGRFTVERATDPGSTTYEDEIGACQADDMRGLFKAFYHGIEGTSVVMKPSDADPNYPISWEHGLDEMLKIDEIRNIVPAASYDKTGWTAGDIDTLVNLFQTHLKDGDDARAERQGYMGLTLPLEASTIQGVTYPRGLLEWIRYLNEERMSMSGQTTKVFASDGVERVLDPWAFACQCAGIQMGTDVGEGLTLKFVKTAELGQPFNDWDPRDRLDQRKALLGGLLYGEPSRGRWRIVRGQTTHISTDNLARTDINVWEIRNLVIRDMREQLEDRFGGVGVGNPAEGVRFVAPASIASIREYVANILEEYRADGIIIDSQDENGQPVHAWTGLSVRISGDVATVKVQVFPKTALNFILIDFGFQIPVLSS